MNEIVFDWMMKEEYHSSMWTAGWYQQQDDEITATVSDVWRISPKQQDCLY